jgi:tetratricopeptide (TPR) repeat protein
VAVAGVFVLGLAVCLPAADAPFTFDEQAGIADNRAIRPGAPLREAILYRYSPDQARPVFFASLLFDADLWGRGPRGFRVIGFLMHLACGAILYLLLRRSDGRAPGAGAAAPGDSLAAALGGTALFLLHPLQSESVLYIWGRSEVLSTLFGLLAVLLALTSGERPTRPERLYLLLAGALACEVLALGSKEEAVVVPLIFFMWWRWVEGRPVRPGTLRALALGVPVVLFLLWRAWVLGGIGRQVFARSIADNVLGQGVVTLRMLRLFVLPFGQSIDHPAEVPGLLAGTLAIAACLLIVGWAIVVLRAGDASPALRRIACGVLVAAAGTVLYWGVPLPDLMCERRAYLPLAGAALTVSGVVQYARRRAGLAVALIVLLLAPAMAARGRVWSDPRRLWEEAARIAPLNARPPINLGVMAAERGDFARALQLFDQAVRREPANPEALFNRGKLHRDAGRHDQAVADLRAAIAASPGMVKARINLAIALMDVHDLAGAESELRAALRIDPWDPRALTNLGEVLRATGRPREAVVLYREALDADPTYSHAAARLGVTLENLGDRQGALAAYREFLARGTASISDREAVIGKVKALEQDSGEPALPPPSRP